MDTVAPLQAQLLEREPVTNAASDKPALHFSGVIDAATPRPAGTRLLVLDAASQVRGHAQISFIAPHKSNLRLDLPVKRGFDGYIADYEAGQSYRLVAADFGSGKAWPVLEIPAEAVPAEVPAATSPALQQAPAALPASPAVLQTSAVPSASPTPATPSAPQPPATPSAQ